jgi:hypothetical protein
MRKYYGQKDKTIKKFWTPTGSPQTSISGSAWASENPLSSPPLPINPAPLKTWMSHKKQKI